MQTRRSFEHVVCSRITHLGLLCFCLRKPRQTCRWICCRVHMM